MNVAKAPRPSALWLPPILAGTSTVLLVLAILLASEGLGGGVAAVPFVFVGTMLGIAGAYTGRKRWPAAQSLSIPARVGWGVGVSVLLLPLAVVVATVIVFVVYTVLYVR